MEKNKLIFIIIFVVLAAIGGILFFVFSKKEPVPQPFALEIWNVFDDSDIYRPLISEFQEKYPYITVNYYKKNITTYEQELVDALASGRGPDIFAINNTWLPKHINKMSPAPAAMVTPKQISESFVDVVANDFIADGKVYALPMSVDTLALYYNKDLFNSEGIAQPPKTWAEFNADVEKMTRKDEGNNILRAAAALGTAKNVNRSTDILALLMMQSGAKMVNAERTSATFDQSAALASGGMFGPGENALLFYTNFANPLKKVYTWNQYQHYSIDAFIEGRAAMMISYSYQIPVLRSRAPHLNFSVAAIPQISDGNLAASFANYWGFAVSKSSSQADGAWAFLSFLATQESEKTYLEAAQKPAARRDLIEWQKSNKDLGVFAQQSLIAKSWWEVDNLAIETIFAQMIDSVAANKITANSAIRNASQQITLLMQKYQSANNSN